MDARPSTTATSSSFRSSTILPQKNRRGLHVSVGVSARVGVWQRLVIAVLVLVVVVLGGEGVFQMVSVRQPV